MTKSFALHLTCVCVGSRVYRTKAKINIKKFVMNPRARTRGCVNLHFHFHLFKKHKALILLAEAYSIVFFL